MEMMNTINELLFGVLYPTAGVAILIAAIGTLWRMYKNWKMQNLNIQQHERTLECIETTSDEQLVHMDGCNTAIIDFLKMKNPTKDDLNQLIKVTATRDNELSALRAEVRTLREARKDRERTSPFAPMMAKLNRDIETLRELRKEGESTRDEVRTLRKFRKDGESTRTLLVGMDAKLKILTDATSEPKEIAKQTYYLFAEDSIPMDFDLWESKGVEITPEFKDTYEQIRQCWMALKYWEQAETHGLLPI